MMPHTYIFLVKKSTHANETLFIIHSPPFFSISFFSCYWCKDQPKESSDKKLAENATFPFLLQLLDSSHFSLQIAEGAYSYEKHCMKLARPHFFFSFAFFFGMHFPFGSTFFSLCLLGPGRTRCRILSFGHYN